MAVPTDAFRIVGGTLVRSGAANAVGAVMVFTYQNFLDLSPADREGTRRAVTAFVAFSAVAFPLAAFLGVRVLAPAVRWLGQGRPASTAERAAVVQAPFRQAALAFCVWLIAIAVFSSLAAVFGDPARQVAGDALGTLLGGLTACTLTFLLVEAHLRPLVAKALKGHPPERVRTIGVRPRLFLSWALGSGVPFLGILSLWVGDRPPTPTPGAVVFLAATGLFVGSVMVAVVARSVAQPVTAVVRSLRRVEEGDLSVTVPVDDGGEIGSLQAGLNGMAAALRERRQLEDLFGRYVGADVARAAIERGATLGGELRSASALFVDVIGSSRMAERRQPAEVIEVLNVFFEAVVRVTSDEGGWVNKFEGDGALCVFGAPAEQPDHAARALRAARRLHLELGDSTLVNADLEAGIGVSSGTVVAGNVGTTDRLEYTVLGDPVNEAARLTDEAKRLPAGVLASARAVDAAGPEGDNWIPVGEFWLRGRSEPTKAYSPCSARQGR